MFQNDELYDSIENYTKIDLLGKDKSGEAWIVKRNSNGAILLIKNFKIGIVSIDKIRKIRNCFVNLLKIQLSL